MFNIIAKLFESYSNISRTFKVYWKAYGGCIALACSPYLHFSIIISLLLYVPLLKDGCKWYDMAISIIPSILGFTLGGYAFLLGVGDERFRFALRGDSQNNSPSPFMVVNSAFVHFIVLQILALLFSIIGKAFQMDSITNTAIRILFNYAGILIFIYSLTTSLAAVFAILNIANWYDKAKKIDEEADKNNSQP